MKPVAISVCGPSRPIAALQFFGRYWGAADIELRWRREGSVAIDPDVWSGRALQENFADLAVSGLASMYPTFDWSVAPGHHGYQRACDLISGKASRRPNGSPVLARAGKTEPPSRLVLSQTSAGNSQFFTQTKRLTPWPASPRSFGHEPERSKQSWPVCWQARSQEHCGAAASWRPRSRA